jgi:riboflavin biosynthesis pyrimidine reductase
VPIEHAALQKGAVIVTTRHGERRLDGHLPEGCTLLATGTASRVDVTALLAAIRRRGHANVLTEGGPHLLSQLIDVGVLDDLFLTVAPVLAGRAVPARPGLISGIELLPQRRESVDLISARRRGSYLFLRYRLGTAAGRGSPATPSRPH